MKEKILSPPLQKVPNSDATDTYYIICATHRSGSTLLCHALGETRYAGDPQEYFQYGAPHSIKWKENEQLEEYIKRVFKSKSRSNGVSGIKIMWNQLEELVEIAKNRGYDDISIWNIYEYFPDVKFIWLTRYDKIRQGISLWKALETGVWLEKTETNIKKKVDFDLQQIHFQVILSKREDRNWQKIFRKNRIKPLKISYEDFIENYDMTLIKILNFLNISTPKYIVKYISRKGPPLKKQADDRSEKFVRLYRKKRLKAYFIYYFIEISEVIHRIFHKLKKRSDLYSKIISMIIIIKHQIFEKLRLNNT